MATQKEFFTIALLDLAQDIAKRVMDKVADMDSQYFDNGYDGAGSDPIIDTDLLNFNGITAAQVANVITVLQQLNNFFQNSAVTTADYSVSLNVVRNAKLN